MAQLQPEEAEKKAMDIIAAFQYRKRYAPVATPVPWLVEKQEDMGFNTASGMVQLQLIQDTFDVLTWEDLRFNTASGMAQLQRMVSVMGIPSTQGFNTASGMAQLQRFSSSGKV